LQVRDTGVGIPEEEMPKLFERFHRIENMRSRTHEGSGIGLALVHELVKLHGGTMRVESKPGNGSTFYVTIPLGKDHLPVEQIGTDREFVSTAATAVPFVEEALRWLPDEPAVRPSEFSALPELLPVPSLDPSRPAAAKPRVLVADDNADMRHYLARLLSERYDVVAVADGREALRSIREHRPDLVLSDIMMPNLDGFGLMTELRSDPATNTLPIILLSARAGQESRVEGLDAGADDYLVKPFSARELLARVSARLTITQLRNASDRALRESEERFRAIVETTPECVKLVAPDGTLLHMNSPGLRMVGAYCADAVVGKSVYDLIAPEHRRRFREFNESVCRGERGSLEFDMLALDGQRRHMESHAAPLPNPDGSRSHLAVTRDITARKKTDSALRESEQRLRALVNASSYMVYQMSPDWRSMRQLDGKGFISDTRGPRNDWLEAYIPVEEQPRVLQAIAEAVRTKGLFSLEHQVKRPDGVIGWILSRAIPLLDDKGEIVEWFGAATDMTARREAEENYRKLAESLDVEVRERTRELEGRNADVLRQSEQLRDLSHRLMRAQDEERRHIARELHDSAGQTLAVLGMHLAQIALESAEAAPQVMKETESAAALLQQLQKEIRTTSYLLHPPLLDEMGLSSALAWYTDGLKERSGLDIELNISEDFGRVPRDMELVIFRLVQECLTNIHRHSGATGASLCIERSSGFISVEVVDNGRGMSAEKLLQVQSGGYGVGLRGMRERVRQFHGEMRIESESSGTRIVVAIPLPKADAEESLSPPMEMKAS
jgi:PAS domain S-box-containing protein